MATVLFTASQVGLNIVLEDLNESVRDMIIREERNRELRMAGYHGRISGALSLARRIDKRTHKECGKQIGQGVGVLAPVLFKDILHNVAELIPDPRIQLIFKITVYAFGSWVGVRVGEAVGEVVGEKISPHLPMWLCPESSRVIKICTEEIFTREIAALTGLSAEVDEKRSIGHVSVLERSLHIPETSAG